VIAIFSLLLSVKLFHSPDIVKWSKMTVMVADRAYKKLWWRRESSAC